jgi:uncharacterized protein
MDIAYFRFHGALNFFLDTEQRSQVIAHPFDWRASIKDMLESLGPPHTEVGLLVVGGRSVDFDYIVQPGDRIEVYDSFEAVDLPEKVRLRPPYPGKPRFILDTHLGRLAGYLRMLGFDTLYRNDYPDDELAQISHDEQRILLTRDIGVLKRGLVIYGYYVRETDPKRRVPEIIKRYNLLDHVEPFKHCMKCNGLVHPVEKADVIADIPPKAAQFYDVFHQCQQCGQIYWKGSHYDRMQAFMQAVTDL